MAFARRIEGAPVFGHDSVVREYWLAHAAGFELRRGRGCIGRVEDVVVDAELGRTQALVVRSPRRRRPTLVPAERVAAVDPLLRFFYVDRPDRLRTSVRAGSSAAERSASALVAATRATSRWSAPRARSAAVAGRAGTARAWSALRPRLAAAAASGRRGAGRAAVAALRASRRVPPVARLLGRRVVFVAEWLSSRRIRP